MGKCLSCLRDNQQHKHQQQHLSSGNSPSSAHHHRTSYLAAAYHRTLGKSESEGSNCSVLEPVVASHSGGDHLASHHQSSTTTTGSAPLAPCGGSGRYSFTDTCSNGTASATATASKLSSIMGVTGGGSSGGNSGSNSSSDKRSFYARIPPLTRSASHETRRHSSKEYYSETKINTLFDIYREPPHLNDDSSSEPVEDVMLSDGIQRFCADLDVSADDFRVLLFAWKCEAETMCRFTRSEFLLGCKSLKADSIKSIVAKFPELQEEAKEFDKFKTLYKWSFKFGLDSDVGQRSLPSDMSILLWKLVFEQRQPKILDRWLAFLESHPNIRGVPRDTWNMFLNFSETIGDDLSTYDDTEAWPSLFDDFVEYENDKLNQNISKDTKQ